MTPNVLSKPVRFGSTLRRVLSGLAALLFVIGVIAPSLHLPPALAVSLRWFGLAVFVPVAVQRRSLLLWTFFAMIIGAEAGIDAPHLAAQTRIIGDVFLRLIRMIVAPLIFGGIVTGIAAHGELRGVGRVAIKSLVFFELVTTVGLIIGLVAMNLSRAGVGIALPVVQANAPAAPHESWQQLILNIFPDNIAQAVAQNQILQVAVFAVLFGVALATLPEQKRAPMVGVLQSLTEAMFRLTRIIMLMAPLAAGAAMAYTVGSMGHGVAASAGQACHHLLRRADCLCPGGGRTQPGHCACLAARVSQQRSQSLPRSDSPPPALKPRCRWRWSAWKISACRAGLCLSSSHWATAST